MTSNEVLDLLRRELQNVDRTRLVYALRKMHFKPIKPVTVELIAGCLALQKLGLPVTTRLMAFLTGKAPESLARPLHILGDKKVLLLLRGEHSKYLRWCLHPLFLKYYGSTV